MDQGDIERDLSGADNTEIQIIETDWPGDPLFAASVQSRADLRAWLTQGLAVQHHLPGPSRLPAHSAPPCRTNPPSTLKRTAGLRSGWTGRCWRSLMPEDFARCRNRRGEDLTGRTFALEV